VKTLSYREASSVDSDEEGPLEDDESVDLDGETVLEEDDNEHHCLEIIASQGSNSIKVHPATASFSTSLTFFQMECDDLNQHILYMTTQPGLRVRLVVRGEWAHLVFAKDKPTRKELVEVNEQMYPEKRLEVHERLDPTLCS
jgi:predicted DNA binding protein